MLLHAAATCSLTNKLLNEHSVGQYNRTIALLGNFGRRFPDNEAISQRSPSHMSRILSYGCGPGEEALALQQWYGSNVTVYCTDIKPGLVDAVARRNQPGIRAVNLSVASSMTFDLVTCFFVLFTRMSKIVFRSFLGDLLRLAPTAAVVGHRTGSWKHSRFNSSLIETEPRCYLQWMTQPFDHHFLALCRKVR